MLRNYRANGFRVAVNVESAEQWRAIAERLSPHFVKIRVDKLGDGPEAEANLKWLAVLRGRAELILTHVEAPSPALAGAPVWLQGYAYGYPAASID